MPVFPSVLIEYIVVFRPFLIFFINLAVSSTRSQKKSGPTISALGNEYDILHRVPVEDIRKRDHILAIAIERLRKKEFESEPGYDGHYGRISFFKEGELEKLKQPQISLF